MTRVLVVDDSQDLQDSYRLLLEADGHEVLEASDGATGLHLACSERPDVILLDMMMPDVDGLQLLRRLPLECASPLPPVIAISAFEMYRQEALRRGARAFLQKPVAADVLREALRAVGRAAPLPAEIERHNRQDVEAARRRGEALRGEVVAALAPPVVDAVRERLRLLASWLQGYFGFGATFIQLLRGDELRVEAARGGSKWSEGRTYSRRLAWCSDVIDAGSTVLLCDPLHHALAAVARHPGVAAGFRFYAGVPLTTWSGAVIGTLCLCDVVPHFLHAEDMRLLEALGLHVAHALGEIADGEEADDFVIDDAGLFAPEMLPTFVQVATQRAARIGGVAGVALVRLCDGDEADAAARAAYAAAGGPGLVIVRRSGAELALVQVGADADARQNLGRALAGCRSAVAVRSIGSAWCRMAAGAIEAADSDLCARLIGFAAESRDQPSPGAHDGPGAHA